MPKVPWNNKLGHIALDFIKSRLEYFSIPIEYRQDVGLDLYCELLENDSPSIPFYVQAKGTMHFDDNWGVSIQKSTIMYWLDQYFPVFLIVYDEKNDICYWMSIEDIRYPLLSKMNETGDTIYIIMDKSHILEKSKNGEFIRKIEENVTSIALWLGHPQPEGREYVKKMPSPPRSEIELLRIKEGLRMNMYSLIRHYLHVNDLKNAYMCCEFLTNFDNSHYNQFVLFAIVNKRLGNIEAAKKNCSDALKICDMDKKWPSDSMEKIKGAIIKIMYS